MFSKQETAKKKSKEMKIEVKIKAGTFLLWSSAMRIEGGDSEASGESEESSSTGEGE